MKLATVATALIVTTMSPMSAAFVAPRPVNSARPRGMEQNMSDNGNSWASDMANGGGMGGIDRLEFKIYPDGRVEETVRGVKGNNCSKITEAINEKLGKVVATAPTEEMYEQALLQDQTVYNTDSTSSSW